MGERWFRLYDGAVHDPKVQTLPAEVFKLWFNLLCIASQNNGVIPPEDQLKSVLSLRYDRIKKGLTILLSRGLIDRIEGQMEPHNWRKRQYKSDTSAERMRSYRQRKSDVTVTPPDTDTETERDKNSYIKEYKNSISCTDTVFPIAPGQPEWDAWERYYLDRNKRLPLAMQRVKDGMQKAMTVKTRFPPS